MLFYTSDFTGSAYTLDGDTLLYTPLHEDLTFDTCLDNWIEVDPMALPQGSDEKVHIEWVRNYLAQCLGDT